MGLPGVHSSWCSQSSRALPCHVCSRPVRLRHLGDTARHRATLLRPHPPFPWSSNEEKHRSPCSFDQGDQVQGLPLCAPARLAWPCRAGGIRDLGRGDRARRVPTRNAPPPSGVPPTSYLADLVSVTDVADQTTAHLLSPLGRQECI
eukprot:gene18847-biopygen21991